MPSACYRAYELEDPREPRLPRWVGYGPGLAPWTTLWDFREHGVGPLFEWLRDVEANGQRPVESRRFGMGRVAGRQITCQAARAAAQIRLMMISRAAAGLEDGQSGQPDPPAFLFNPKPGPSDVRKPIVAESPDGKTWPLRVSRRGGGTRVHAVSHIRIFGGRQRVSGSGVALRGGRGGRTTMSPSRAAII
jgi:hypothetical protein